jgi:hypothetical protein
MPKVILLTDEEVDALRTSISTKTIQSSDTSSNLQYNSNLNPYWIIRPHTSAIILRR